MIEEDKITAKITGFIGHNRVGKTTLIRDLINSYRASKPKHHKVLAFDPQSKFTDLIDERIGDNDIWPFLFEERDMLIVIDDCHMLLDAEKLERNFYKLLSLRDDNGIDIVLSMHHPEQIHKKVSFYVTDFYLFYINLSDDTRDCRRKLMNADYVIDIIRNINEYVKIHGKWGANEGDFRYVIYDNQSSEIKTACNLGETGEMLYKKYTY